MSMDYPEKWGNCLVSVSYLAALCWWSQSFNQTRLPAVSAFWDDSCDLILHCALTVFTSGMCNPKNYSDTPATSKSTVEELQNPIPSLFRALTEGDVQINMMVVSFPVSEELSHHENLVSFLETLNSQHENVTVPGNSIHGSLDSQGNAAALAWKSTCSHFTTLRCDHKVWRKAYFCHWGQKKKINWGGTIAIQSKFGLIIMSKF